MDAKIRADQPQRSPTKASPSRRKPVQGRSKATVARLLDALGAHLAEFGFRALNTNSIAARAGVSVGTLYSYFPDIVAMLDAYAARSLEAWLELWTSEPAFEPRSEWREQFRRSFRETVRRARADYAYVLIVNSYGAIPEFDDTIGRIREKQVQATISIHTHANSELSRARAELISRVLLDLGWTAVLHAARGAPNPELEQEYENVIISYMAQYLDEP